MISYNMNGFAEQKSVFALQSAEKVNAVIDQLPIATNLKVWTTEFSADSPDGALEAENFKAIYVESATEKGIVNVPTRRYEIVQHKDAIRPIIDALVMSGVQDFEFNAQATLSWANLNVFVGSAGYDGVKLGFKVGNSFDSSSAVSYGIDVTHSTHTIEMVGYRMACSNGLKIIVPLDQAELIRPEIREQVTTLLKERTRVLHTKSASSKIEAMKYVVEAVALLRDPAEAMIKKAQTWKIDDTELFKALIKAHVGNRFAKKVEHQYNKDSPEDSLWNLYNAMTFVASHDESLSVTARETLIDKAAKMLTVELFPVKGKGGQ